MPGNAKQPTLSTTNEIEKGAPFLVGLGKNRKSERFVVKPGATSGRTGRRTYLQAASAFPPGSAILYHLSFFRFFRSLFSCSICCRTPPSTPRPLGMGLNAKPELGGLLSPASHDYRWDIIAGNSFGTDVIFIEHALSYAFEQRHESPSRIAVGGFTDGASYALVLAWVTANFSPISSLSRLAFTTRTRTGENPAFIFLTA